MRLPGFSYGASHDALVVTPDDHHPRPTSVNFSDTSTSIPPSSSFNLDVTLPDANYQVAKVYLEGPAISGGGSGSKWRECAQVHVTTVAAEAIGHSNRNTGSIYKSYVVTYSKALGVTNLTHKIFDNVTSPSSRYIALQNAQIIGTTLRLTFRNYFGGSASLSVKGHALVY
jgi:hypothetical protein